MRCLTREFRYLASLLCVSQNSVLSGIPRADIGPNLPDDGTSETDTRLPSAHLVAAPVLLCSPAAPTRSLKLEASRFPAEVAVRVSTAIGEFGPHACQRLQSCLFASDETIDFYSEYAVEAVHRHDQISIPSSHARHFLPRSVPSRMLLNMQPWRNAFNIAGYCHDGSFRYEEGESHKLLQSRVVYYHRDDHASRNPRYNGSLIVLPKMQVSKDQSTIWVAVSRILGRCTALHESHRLAICSSPTSVQAQM